MKGKTGKKKVFFLMISAFLILFLTGCDYFTGPAGEDGIDGVSGIDGVDGIDGLDGGNIPGGLLTINFSYLASMNADSRVRIVFDPDEAVLSGNETEVSIPVGVYIDPQSSSVYTTLTWNAPDVTPGSYYIYYWLDVNADGVFDSGTEQSSIRIYNFIDTFNFGLDIYLIDPYSTMEISTTAGTYLAPYYTVSQNFAPTINILYSYSEG